jgi:hypothetical protein
MLKFLDSKLEDKTARNDAYKETILKKLETFLALAFHTHWGTSV